MIFGGDDNIKGVGIGFSGAARVNSSGNFLKYLVKKIIGGQDVVLWISKSSSIECDK